MSGSIKEKLLLYRLQTKHDPEAFTELYDLYVKRIYRFVYFKVSGKEEAEDITSEVFLKTWNYVIGENTKEIKSFSGLLYRLARNAIIDLYRRRSTQPQVIITEEIELSDGGKWYEDLNRNADAAQIISALKKLKQEYQEVLTLRYVDELDVDEIAEIIGKGGIATRVTIHRAIKKLKEILGG
ncbi:MAG: sigma-70 family RNA polymerase sigma factor [Candidatus Magasanikbacteria bacterium]